MNFEKALEALKAAHLLRQPKQVDATLARPLVLTLPPINEWGSKVQKISSLLSHQPMLLVGYNTKTLSYFL